MMTGSEIDGSRGFKSNPLSGEAGETKNEKGPETVEAAPAVD
jgi:hypothetical protein